MERPRILIIDNRDLREVTRILEDEGYHVAVAGDLDAARRLSEEQVPEVALLGIQSPGFDGLKILQALKREASTRLVQVILLLDSFDEHTVVQGLQRGAADYLVKPWHREVLLRRIGVLAELCRQERQDREVLSRYQEFFEGEEQGLFLSTREGRVLDLNQNLVNLLGYDSRDELLGTDIGEKLYWDPSERERFREFMEARGLVKNFRVHFRRKDGQKIPMVLNGRVVRDASGEVIGYQGYRADASEAVGSGEGAPETSEEPGFVRRFLKHFTDTVFPFGSDFFSLMKMTELVADRYEKVARLAFGSFGEIWKVRDIENERAPYYVAKIPRSKKLNAKFRKEADICRSLQGHPNMIQIVDIVEDRDRLVLVQEYVEGPTLKEMMDRPLENTDRERIVVQLVDIVAHAHRNRIAHRDIKPENIIVRHDGTVKLLDYGVAKELKDQEFSSTLVGSRRYMAPEQIMGESQIASDVWALGVILYELYTEYPPFFDDNEKVLMDLILTREPDPPREIEPEVPLELEEIILKCLRKDPGERFADAGILKKALLEKFPRFGQEQGE
jgi:PAS domain S-box-containing protein